MAREPYHAKYVQELLLAIADLVKGKFVLNALLSHPNADFADELRNVEVSRSAKNACWDPNGRDRSEGCSSLM